MKHASLHDEFSELVSDQLGDPCMVVGYILITDTIVDGKDRAVIMNHSEAMPGWMVRGMMHEAKLISQEFDGYELELDGDEDAESGLDDE